MSEQSPADLMKDYYLGNFQSCINKANLSEATREATFYLISSYYHTKKFDNIRLEASKSDHKFIKLIQLLMSYDQSSQDEDAIIRELDGMIETKSIDSKDDLSRLVASSIYARHKSYSKALSVLQKLDSAPVYFARLQIHIMMSRTDIAEKDLKDMEKKDEYPFLTKLATAHLLLATNNPREAHELVTEIEEQYRATPLLKNLQTAAAICVGDFETAKQHCENSLDLDNDNLQALINMIHILSRMGASQEIKERNIDRLRKLYPDDEFVRQAEVRL